jgi:hypothetical protein
MGSESPLDQLSPSRLKRPSGMGLTSAVAVVAVLMLGIQLGGVPWRYRKQLWQLQGVVVGALVGYALARFSVAKDRRDPPGL